LLIARAFGGIMSGNLVTAMAYASDITPNENRARVSGIVGSAYGVGFAAGPPLGGWLGEMAGHGVNPFWPGVVAAALSVLATIGTLGVVTRDSRRDSRRPVLGGPVPIEPAVSSSWRALNPRLLALPVVFARGGFREQRVAIGIPVLGAQRVRLVVASDRFAVRGDGCDGCGSRKLSIGPASHRFGERLVTSASLVAVVLALAGVAARARPARRHGSVFFVRSRHRFVLPGEFVARDQREATPDRRGAVLGAINAAGTAGRIAGPALAGPLDFGFGSWTTSSGWCLDADRTVRDASWLCRARRGARRSAGLASISTRRHNRYRHRQGGRHDQ
jgi:MFS family permease